MDRIIDAFVQLYMRYRKDDTLTLSLEDFSAVLGLSKSTTIECLKVMVSRQYLLKGDWRAGCKGRPRNVYCWGISGDNTFNNWLNGTTQFLLGDYIRELYAGTCQGHSSAKKRMTFQTRCLLSVLLRKAYGSGLVPESSLGELSGKSGLSYNSVRYKLKELIQEEYIFVFKGESAPNIFKSPASVYYINLLHPAFSNAHRSLILYKFKANPELGDYSEAEVIYQAAMQVKRSRRKYEDGARRDEVYSRNKYLSDLSVFNKSLRAILSFYDHNFEHLAFLFERKSFIPYLQMRLNCYASYLLNFFWQDIDTEQVIMPLLDLICSQLSLNRFRYQFDGDEDDQIFDMLVIFIYQVSFGIARKVKAVIEGVNEHHHFSLYSFLSPKTHRISEGGSFLLLSVSSAARPSLLVEFNEECSGMITYQKKLLSINPLKLT